MIDMMNRRTNHRTAANVFKFQLSGFHNAEKNRLARYITKLSGRFLDSKEFLAEATHIISKRPTRGEKYLCGCAAGIWVLTPDYIESSVKAGRWLDEVDFLWGNYVPDDSKCPIGMIRSPKRWREYIEQTGKHAFSGWTIALMVQNVQRRPAVYKRLLRTGGAHILSITDAAASTELTHILVDEIYKDRVEQYMKRGVACVLPSFLSEVLFEEDPNMVNFLVSNSTLSAASPDANGNNIKRAFVSVSSPKRTLENSAVNTSLIKTRSGLITQTFKCNAKTKSKHSKNIPSDVTESSKQDFTAQIHQTSPVSEPRSNDVKRKLVFSESNIQEAVQSLKRQKLEGPSFSLVPYWMQVLPKRAQLESAVPFPHLITTIIETAMDEGQWMLAVHQTQTSLSSKYYPPPELLNMFMREMLVTQHGSFCHSVIYLLKTVLCLHPPSSSPSLPIMYMRTLCPEGVQKKSYDSSHTFEKFNTPWEFVSHVISDALGLIQDPQRGGVKGQSLDLLHYLVALFEHDFHAFCNRWKNNEKNSAGFHRSMLAKMLWPNGQIKPTALHMRRLMDHLVAAAAACQASEDQTYCLHLLQAMFGMAAQCCRIAQAKVLSNLVPGLDEQGLHCDLVRELVSRLNQNGLLVNRPCLTLFIETTCIPWVKSLIVATILIPFNDALVTSSNIKDQKLSLNKIVKWYFYLLPKLGTSTAKDSASAKSSPRVQFKTDELKILTSQNNRVVKRISKVNKRNARGETSLHVACIKGNLIRVKELLKQPGIDVNSKDNVGWTPMHEACNHGHVLCVRELLQFKPQHSIMDYMNKDSPRKTSGVVNLLSAPSCGTTPLHDAVNNGQVEIARLLVQHQGTQLLSACNIDGRTPLDIAVTEDMKRALQLDQLSMSDKENKIGETSLHFTHANSEDSNGSCVPSDRAYSLALGKPAALATANECAIFGMLIKHLLKDYISSHDLQMVKQEVDFVCSRIQHNKTAPSQAGPNILDLPLKTNGRSFTKWTAYTSSLNDQRLVDDLIIFSELGEHIEHFNKHLRRIGQWSDTELSSTYEATLRELQMVGSLW